jgi:hypothetical protein
LPNGNAALPPGDGRTRPLLAGPAAGTDRAEQRGNTPSPAGEFLMTVNEDWPPA